MSEEEAKKFKDFGYSDKVENKDIGHKGIGAKCLYTARDGAIVYTKEKNGSLLKIVLNPTDLGENPTTEARIERYKGKSLYDAYPSEKVKNLKSGTIIIMNNLDHINLNTDINWLKEIVNRKTHVGGYDSLPTFEESDYKEYPRFDITVGDKTTEFYAFRRIMSEEAIKIANQRMKLNSINGKPIKFVLDEISNSNEYRAVIESLNNSNWFRYDFERVLMEFGGRKLYYKMYFISALNGKLLYQPVRGTAKDVSRGMWTGRDDLPVHQIWKSGMTGLDFNVHQNYTENYIDIPIASLTTNRNEIIGYGTNEFNDLLNELKIRFLNTLVDRNSDFLQKIVDHKNSNEKINFSHRRAINEYKNCLSINMNKLQNYPEIENTTSVIAQRNERGLISLLWQIHKRYNPETGERLLPYEILLEEGGKTKGAPDLKVIHVENINRDAEGNSIYSQGDVKNAEVETSLHNFSGHKHSTEVIDVVFCWDLGNWKVNNIKVINGVDVALYEEDGNYFLHAEQGDKKIPIIIGDDIVKNNANLFSPL